jgi:uncharacterized membrane protein
MSDSNYNPAAGSQPSSGVPASYPPPPAYTDSTQGYGQVPPAYGQPGYTTDPYAAQPAAAGGLSDNAAGALAYVTIIPAILFLVLAPYNTKPFVKFHAFQCLGLAVTGFILGAIGIIPILGWIVFFLGMLTLAVLWVICVVKAVQGGAFKLPVIGNFAAQQSGYVF